jgi:predicted AlkP superfamily phosphohydrolase/phosphomutase
MFWRFGEPDHPANRQGSDPRYRDTIERHYRRCDEIVGRVLAEAGPDTLVIVLSDHGFTSFRRGVHLNGWLHDQGLLALKPGVLPGQAAGEFFREVDWSRTAAYALGLGGIYLNRRGREGQGTLSPDEADAAAARIQAALPTLTDPASGGSPVRGVRRREEIYSGPCTGEAPDLLVLFEAGYRASWTTALGGVGDGLIEDNTRRWSGDHIVDPALVPGVLFMSRPFAAGSPSLLDLAPTILAALGAPRGALMEGVNLLA